MQDQTFIQEIIDFQTSIVIITDGNKVLAANRAFLELFGVESVAVFREKYDCICELFMDKEGFLPSDKGVWKDIVVENKKRNIASLALIRKDDKEHIFRVNINSISDGVHKVATFEDVTEYEESQKKLEEAKANLEEVVRLRTWEQIEINEELERQKELLEKAQEIAKIGHWNYERSAKKVEISREIATICGIEFKRFVHPMQLITKFYRKDRRKLFDFLRKLKEVEGTDTIVLRALSGTNEQKTIRVYAEAFVDRGEIYKISGVCQDISETRRLESKAFFDHLTGAYNRSKMEELLALELTHKKLYKTSLSLIIFDIDHFKRVNDTYGHLVGDQVLSSIASRVKNTIRDSDIFARWGGEEFIVVLPESTIDHAVALAGRLKAFIQNYPFDQVGEVTCSFGVIEFREDETQNEGIKRCDDALYMAKRSGRNCVVQG